MKPLPLPLRVAAGLAVTAVDRARHLPEKLAELPVTVVSQALQLSMRVQQQVTELAIKGDDALSALRPVEEKPEWATFDEDKTTANTTTAERTVAAYDATPVWGNGESRGNGGRSKFDAVELTDDEDTEAEAETADEAEPDALPIYAQLTLAQVRGRLRRFDEDQLTELIDFEQRHDNRADFVGMLTRRLNTLRDQQ